MTRRKNFSSRTIELLLTAIEKDHRFLKPSFSFWNIVPPEDYSNAMNHLLTNLETQERLLCLNLMLRAQRELPMLFYEEQGLVYSELTYQEINLLLEILSLQGIVSSNIIHKIIPLLDSNNFLIARRIYWFLSEQELTGEQESMLEDFYGLWKERL